jgi:hypothetical protein
MLSSDLKWEFYMDRIAHLVADIVMAIATVTILGPGASVLAQYAARHAMVAARLKRRRLVR